MLRTSSGLFEGQTGLQELGGGSFGFDDGSGVYYAPYRLKPITSLDLSLNSLIAQSATVLWNSVPSGWAGFIQPAWNVPICIFISLSWDDLSTEPEVGTATGSITVQFWKNTPSAPGDPAFDITNNLVCFGGSVTAYPSLGQNYQFYDSIGAMPSGLSTPLSDWFGILSSSHLSGRGVSRGRGYTDYMSCGGLGAVFTPTAPPSPDSFLVYPSAISFRGPYLQPLWQIAAISDWSSIDGFAKDFTSSAHHRRHEVLGTELKFPWNGPDPVVGPLSTYAGDPSSGPGIAAATDWTFRLRGTLYESFASADIPPSAP